MVTKICVATINHSKPVLLESIFDNGTLVMSEPISCPSSRDAIMDQLLPRLIHRRSRGYKVMVDEVSGELSRAAGCKMVRLSDPHYDGRPVLSVALDRYNEMINTKSLIKPVQASGFEIPKSLVDITSNAKGESVYSILWEDVKPTHILTILTVYATLHHSPGGADYINQMTAEFGNAPVRAKPGNWLTEHFNNKDAPSPSLSGTKTNDGDLIL